MRGSRFLLSKIPRVYLCFSFIFMVILFIVAFNCHIKKSDGHDHPIEEPFSTNEREVGVKMFYVDWCGHCKTTKPGFKQFMGKYNNTLVKTKRVKIELINCEENEKNKKLANEHNVKGYPTIIANNGGKKHVYASSDRSSAGFGSWLESTVM